MTAARTRTARRARQPPLGPQGHGGRDLCGPAGIRARLEALRPHRRRGGCEPEAASPAKSPAFSAPRAAARPRCCASPRGSRSRMPGRLLFDGQEMAGPSPLRAAGEAQHRADVPGFRAVSASVRSSRTWPSACKNLPREEARTIARHALERVGLAHYAAELSAPSVGRRAAARGAGPRRWCRGRR